MNIIESTLFFVALIILVVFEYKHGFSWKQIIFSMLVLVPVLFFSLNMLTEVVTTDEPSYIFPLTHLRQIKFYPQYSLKLIKQYKISQLIIGAEFLLFPEKVKEGFSTYQLWAIYKVCHWTFIFALILVIVHCFDKWLVESEKNRFIMDLGVLCTLLGLPVSCLLLKVVNYDGFGVYLDILCYVLLLSGEKQKKITMFFISVCLASLAVMEKGANLPYWMFCIVLVIYFVIKEKKEWKQKLTSCVCASAMCLFASVFSSFFYFLISKYLQNGFYTKITVAVFLRSFVGTFDNFGFTEYNSLIFLLLMIVGFAFVALLLDGIIRYLKRRGHRLEKVVLYCDSCLLLLLIVLGILGAYFVPSMKAPFAPIKEGYYSGRFGYVNASAHYGARTFLGHVFLKNCYSFGVIMSSFPVIVIALFLGIVILCFKKQYDKRASKSAALMGAFLVAIIGFNTLGLRVSSRYYAIPLLMTVILGIYLCGLFFPVINKSAFRRIGVLFLVYCIEMMLFMPNVKVFSPMWLWRSSAINTEIKQGVLYGGGAYLWGEEITICGKAIDRIVTEEGKYKPDEITIFADYGITWPSNPGYNLIPINRVVKDGQQVIDFTFDDKTYYVFAKFERYRYEIPTFLYDVKPIYAINYKGEIGAWVYRGDQLEEYRDWFDEALVERFISKSK